MTGPQRNGGDGTRLRRRLGADRGRRNGLAGMSRGSKWPKSGLAAARRPRNCRNGRRGGRTADSGRGRAAARETPKMQAFPTAGPAMQTRKTVWTQTSQKPQPGDAKLSWPGARSRRNSKRRPAGAAFPRDRHDPQGHGFRDRPDRHAFLRHRAAGHPDPVVARHGRQEPGGHQRDLQALQRRPAGLRWRPPRWPSPSSRSCRISRSAFPRSISSSAPRCS